MSSTLLCTVAALLAVLNSTTALPDGFSREELMWTDVATGISSLPDGRLLIAERFGRVLLVDPNASPATHTKYLSLERDLYTQGEKGLLSVLVDDDFENTGAFYVYYSPWSGKRTFRISKFVHIENSGGMTSHADPSSEEILWEDPDGTPGPYHYGGQLSFGPDGCIYIGLGDKYEPDWAQDLNKMAGSIVRINKDGSIPRDNFGYTYDGPGGVHDSIWAYGLRNAWRAVWDIPTEQYFIAEVGGNKQAYAVEDLHLGKPGKNYGWPLCEGPCDNKDYRSTCDCSQHDTPIYYYDHKDSNLPTGLNAAIIGGYVNRGTMFPSEYDGAYFFGDFNRGWLKYLKTDKHGRLVGEPETFDTRAQEVITIVPGVDGSMYYATKEKLFRISYSSDNSPPEIISAKASTNAGPLPLEVTLKGKAWDMDGDKLHYTWHVDGRQYDNRKQTIRFDSVGVHSARLQVSDGKRSVFSEEIEIQAGVAPEFEISEPKDGAKFHAGDMVKFSAELFDPKHEYGLEYSWEVALRHDDHFHDVMQTSVASGDFEVETSGHGFTDGISFVISLTMKNQYGLEATRQVEIFPDLVDITLDVNVPGIDLFLDAIPVVKLPVVVSTVIGFNHDVAVAPSVCVKDQLYIFRGWEGLHISESNMKAHDHELMLTVPPKGAHVQAVFDAVGSCGSDFGVVEPSKDLVFHLSAGKGTKSVRSSLRTWKDQVSEKKLKVKSGAAFITKEEGHPVVVLESGTMMELKNKQQLNLPAETTIFLVTKQTDAISFSHCGLVWDRENQEHCHVDFSVGFSNRRAVPLVKCDVMSSDTKLSKEDGDWMIITVVVNDRKVRLYHDGTKIDSIDLTSSIKKSLADGSFSLQAVGATLHLSEVRVYNKALSKKERMLVETLLGADHDIPTHY